MSFSSNSCRPGKGQLAGIPTDSMGEWKQEQESGQSECLIPNSPAFLQTPGVQLISSPWNGPSITLSLSFPTCWSTSVYGKVTILGISFAALINVFWTQQASACASLRALPKCNIASCEKKNFKSNLTIRRLKYWRLLGHGEKIPSTILMAYGPQSISWGAVKGRSCAEWNYINSSSQCYTDGTKVGL